MAGESSQCGKGMGFGFSVDQMSNLESNPELFNLTTGMEMLAFPSKTRDANSLMWKEYFSKPPGNHGGSSSSSGFYQGDEFNYKPDFTSDLSETTTDNLIHSSWQHQHQHNNNSNSNSNSNSNRYVGEDSPLPCVFPYEGREMRTQGLSLSLSSQKSSSSTIGLQTLELIRGTTTQLQHQRHQPQQQQILQDSLMGLGANLHQSLIHLKDSKYLAPCQELLNEFCSLGTKKTGPHNLKSKINQWQEGNGGGSSSKKSSLDSFDMFELQKRKSKLVSMLEEVDRRYKQYCDQMRSVVSSFEAVVGRGAGLVYSALASRAMSRHFRCLRDAIKLQIKATNMAMGEKDPVVPGSTRGETPRLRLLDQTHRQERAFRQMSVIESRPWRPQRGLPERSVSLLRAWLFEHFLHPYPSDVDKHILARQTGLSRSQVSNWFINARVRLWKPMVEEMYLEESKEGTRSPQLHYEDQKPTLDHQMVRGDTGSLSSIIINNNSDKIHGKSVRNHNEQQLGRDAETFGAIDLDFSSYNNNGVHQNFGSGVSLTLGLQQHDENESGMNISFAAPSQHSLFFPRDDEDEECEQLQYSIIDGEVQNPPYRNLMGVQLLHDLAG